MLFPSHGNTEPVFTLREYMSALIYHADRSNLESFKCVFAEALKHELDINFENGLLVFIACNTNNIKLAKLLINYGVDVRVNKAFHFQILLENKRYKLYNILKKHLALTKTI